MFGRCVPRIERGTGMRRVTPEGTADDDRESWEAGEEARALASLEADGAPASAEQFRITNLQHWIDLSA